MSRFVQFLQYPEPIKFAEFAQQWFDQEVVYDLKLTREVAPSVLAVHLRRSFLPQLRAGASAAAINGEPCPWDPPCALDIFRREQLRYKGLGLPKPYVISVDMYGLQCRAKLRVFGAANDWFWLVAEAFGAGIRALPWRERLGMALPVMKDRQVEVTQGVLGVRAPCRVVIGSPLDIDHLEDDEPIGRSVLVRALQRVDGLARWHGFLISDCEEILDEIGGVLLSEDIGRHIHYSPNAKRQARHKRVAVGEIVFDGYSDNVASLIALGVRSHVGRGAVEGMGDISAESFAMDCE